MATKPIWNLRPEPFLVEAVDAYANTHKMKDETGAYNRTEVLHAMVKELLDKARRVSMAESDKETYRLQAEDLRRKFGTFRCVVLQQDVNGVFCESCCKSSDLPDVPSDVRDCPKAIAYRKQYPRTEKNPQRNPGPIADMQGGYGHGNE